ncbi:winged helix-turn-helix domain-containing protein [Chloroflexota bacterium]
MAIPLEESIRLPLLRVIADAGGELTLQESVTRVEAFFPHLTTQDRQLRLPSGKGFLFTNRVQWTRQRLVELGHLYREPRGMWRITPQGRTFLEENWSNWQPCYSTDELHKGKRRRQLEGLKLEEDLRQDTKPAPQIPVLRPHEHLKELLRQVGDILGYYPEIEFREPPYVYDVVWKTFLEAPRPGFVFEVQDKGNLIEALAKLQHAKDTWGSKLFLTVTGDRDRKRIEKLVAPLLAGTFHRLARDLVLLSPEQIEKLFEPLNQNRDLLRKLLLE